MKYSADFEALIARTGVEPILLSSCCTGPNFEIWDQRRRFIASLITRSGSILDIGCANGLLLRCLQEWCAPLELDPYGIDVNMEAVEKAQKMFPAQSDHFCSQSLNDFLSQTRNELPTNFDYVFCSLLSPSPDQPEEGPYIRQVIDGLLPAVKPKGRLILGAYGTNQWPRGSSSQTREMERLRQQYKTATELGYQISGYLENPHGWSGVLFWIDAL